MRLFRFGRERQEEHQKQQDREREEKDDIWREIEGIQETVDFARHEAAVHLRVLRGERNARSRRDR